MASTQNIQKMLQSSAFPTRLTASWGDGLSPPLPIVDKCHDERQVRGVGSKRFFSLSHLTLMLSTMKQDQGVESDIQAS